MKYVWFCRIIYKSMESYVVLITFILKKEKYSHKYNLIIQTILMKNYVAYSDEVKHAIENNLPIVALESTIISHGMPYPKNLETAKKQSGMMRFCEIFANNGFMGLPLALAVFPDNHTLMAIALIGSLLLCAIVWIFCKIKYGEHLYRKRYKR